MAGCRGDQGPAVRDREANIEIRTSNIERRTTNFVVRYLDKEDETFKGA